MEYTPVLSEEIAEGLRTERDRLVNRLREFEQVAKQKADVEEALDHVTALLATANDATTRKQPAVPEEMGLRDAVRAVLSHQRKGIGSAEITAEIERRGLVVKSDSKHSLLERVRGEVYRMRVNDMLTRTRKKYKLKNGGGGNTITSD